MKLAQGENMELTVQHKKSSICVQVHMSHINFFQHSPKFVRQLNRASVITSLCTKAIRLAI